MKKQILAGLLLATGILSTHAQTFPATWSNRMQTVLDSVNTVQGNAIGVTAAVYMPGYGLWTGATGISSPGVPMTTDMRVLIASNTKLFTAVTILKLQEQGVLSLDDHIGRWIHYGPTTVDTTATIRQLLSHESGMGDWNNDHVEAATNYVWSDTSAIISLKTSVDSAGAPVYPKGRGFHYSNSAYSLCGMIIKEATGLDFWQVMRAQVFDPLNMDSTFFPVYEPYQPIAGTNYEGTLYHGYGFTSFITQDAPAGSIASTPQEMVQWYQQLFNDNFLSAASRQELLKFDPATMYSLGLWEMISPRVGGEYYHSGVTGAFLSEALFDKDTKASIFIATNTVMGEDYYPGQYLAPLLDVFTKEMPKMTHDAGITAMTEPHGSICDGQVNPVVTLKNYGSADLTSAIIKLYIGAAVMPAATLNWTGNLATGDTTSVSLPTTTIPNGVQDVTVLTVMPNGVSEYPGGHTWNDSFRTHIAANLAPPLNGSFTEDFEGTTTSLLIWSIGKGMEGQAGVTHLAGYNSIHSLAGPWATNQDYGLVSNIDLPLIKLVDGPSSLSFRYAYKHWPDAFDDSLQVVISTNCGNSWTSLFNKGGQQLSDGQMADVMYFPQTSNEWKTENIPLAAYQGDALIRFSQHNGYGNNIYIDDIQVALSSGINEIAGKTSIMLFPNPALGNVAISGLPIGTTIRICNITGQTLLEKTVGTGSETLVDISTLSPGIYVVSTPMGTKKLVKL